MSDAVEHGPAKSESDSGTTPETTNSTPNSTMNSTTHQPPASPVVAPGVSDAAGADGASAAGADGASAAGASGRGVLARAEASWGELGIPSRMARRASIEVLSLIAYGELAGAFATAQDAATASRLDDKLTMARVAQTDFAHYEKLAQRLRELGAEPEQSMAAYMPAIDAWHRQTTPGTWLEALMKAYAGTAIATDFYTEISRLLDEDSRAVILEAVDQRTLATFAVEQLRPAIAADERVGARLALWGRRLIGEALSQAQTVVNTHGETLELLLHAGVAAGADLGELEGTFERLRQQHVDRIQALGLSA